ncbi:MAG: helix-turn-helix domain-containing protein [Rhodocyclaceae bacterium]
MGTIDILNPHEMCAELGKRCRNLRLARNLSQAELAAMTGSSLSSVRRLEARGQGTLLQLVRIAEALHVSHHFESLLMLPIVHIADVERATAVAARKRAGRRRARA